MRRLAVLAATAALASLPTVAAAGSSLSPPAVAHAARTSATIAGQHKCIARGQYCQHTSRARRDHRRYGLDCTKRDRNGRYHLQ
jgi:hypothetical protein